MTFFIQLVSASKQALGSNWCKKQRDTRGRYRRGERKRALSVRVPSNLLRTLAHNCHGKKKNLKAKTKYFTAKPKTSRQKQNTSRQNQNPHGKTKDLTAEPKTSRQNQILHNKNQIPHGKSKYPGQNQSYFVFAAKYLVLR